MGEGVEAEKLVCRCLQVSQVWGNRVVTMGMWRKKAVRKNFMDMCYIFVF